MDIQKKKKKHKKSKTILKLILFIVLITAIFIPLALSPICNISGIDVSGNVHYKTNEITDVIDLSVGQNAFKALIKSIPGLIKLRYNIAENNIIKKCPYIKKAIVKYRIPDKVSIIIEEREPMCLISHQGTYLIMDREGYIIDSVKDNEGYMLPVIKGIKIDSYELGQALKLEDGVYTEKINSLLSAIKKSDEDDDFKLQDILDSIDISSINKISLFIDSRIVVNLGDLRDINYRISVLKHIIQNNIKSEDKGLLDFTTGEKPVFKQEN